VPADSDTVDVLTRVLVRACRALAEAGQPRRAGVLAADAWVAVRHTHARQAQHLDGVMHHIARREQQHERPHDQRKETGMSTPERELDVRSEEPRRRHELIFASFIGLPVGDSYVLVNEHDPKPLRYQFEAENTGEYSWERAPKCGGYASDGSPPHPPRVAERLTRA
jgi:uncharacterized protein (DUF2249 family)